MEKSYLFHSLQENCVFVVNIRVYFREFLFRDETFSLSPRFDGPSHETQNGNGADRADQPTAVSATVVSSTRAAERSTVITTPPSLVPDKVYA